MKEIKNLSILLLLSSFFVENVVDSLSIPSPIVTTQTGQVVGTTDSSFFSREYFSYRGIPYAEPPVGDLRFKPSIDKQPWEGVLDGSVNGAPCIQLNRFNESEAIGSEDCLFLNVYTPKLPNNETELLPVLVFIHGGRWLVGTASDLAYSPIYLMDQDIVLVSIQYRVGAMGFLSTGDAEAPGNYGLHDQVKALEWIQKNIQAFGGDPDKVTVSGQSAGAASSHMHLFSPISQGLFRSIISFSGSAMNFWANRIVDDHLRYAHQQGNLVGCPTEESKALIDCLRTVSAEEITLAQSALHDFFGGTPAKLPLSTFMPRVDKEAERPFLPKTALEMVRQGEMPSHPFLTGITSQEGAYVLASMFGQDSMAYLKEFDENSMDAMRSMTGNLFDDENEIQKIFDFYLNNEPVANQSQRIAMTEILSDNIFTFENLMSAYFHARASSKPVYLFKFDYEGLWSFAHEFEETEHDYNGVAHLDDLRYLFRLSMGPELSVEEIGVMIRFTEYIANFVKYSQPTLHGEWTPYVAGDGGYMVIDVPDRSGMSRVLPFETVERPGRMEFWRQMFGYSENLADDYLMPEK